MPAPRILPPAVRAAFLLVMLAGSLLITATSLAYFDPETFPPFAIEKLPVRFEALWLASLKVHVASAALSFPLCLALMTRSLQKRRSLHRWLGRLTATCILLALVPSGMVLALDAKGGAVVTTGFWLSGAIVAGAIVYGVLAARRRDLISHARAMRHVVAQMSVAVSSRAMIFALDAAGSDPELVYVLALWGPVLASAVVAELISRRPLSFNPFPTLHRISHDLSSLVLLARSRPFARPVVRPGR